MVKQVACSSVGSQRGDLIGWSLSAAIVVYFVHPRSDTERTPKTVTAGSAVERRQLMCSLSADERTSQLWQSPYSDIAILELVDQNHEVMQLGLSSPRKWRE